MKTELLTIASETPTLGAFYTMREKNIGCLPVVSEGKLLGLMTAHELPTRSTRLPKERLREL
jgi:CBS domain-containing protein